MPPQSRVSVSGSDTHAAGRGRQHLKLGAIGYSNARHGIDASEQLLRVATLLLCQKAVDFVMTLPDPPRLARGIDLLRGDVEPLQLAAIAYSCARHGVDADVGMAREGMAFLCQAAIDYVESLPKEDAGRRSSSAHLQLGHGP